MMTLLVGGFVGGTPTNFHAADGSGYEFLGDMVGCCTLTPG